VRQRTARPVIVGNPIRLASEVESGDASWLMRDVCSLICAALIGLFRSRASLQAEILTLRHQLNVLRRKSPQRLTFTSIDRLVFAGLYRLAKRTMKLEKSAPDAEGRDIIQYRCELCKRIELVRLFRRSRDATP
jgi:hypothetical protein